MKRRYRIERINRRDLYYISNFFIVRLNKSWPTGFVVLKYHQENPNTSMYLRKKESFSEYYEVFIMVGMWSTPGLSERFDHTLTIMPYNIQRTIPHSLNNNKVIFMKRRSWISWPTVSKHMQDRHFETRNEIHM